MGGWRDMLGSHGDAGVAGILGRRSLQPTRLTVAQTVCRPLPPLGARLIGERIYSRKRGRRENVRFVRRAQTGSWFTGTTGDFNAHPFALCGRSTWRNWVIARMLSSPGDTIVEIGANVGTETVGFSDLVGAAGKVFAFEPLPDNLLALDRTVPLLTYANVTVLPHAVGAVEQQLHFAAPPPTARSQGIGHILGPEEKALGKITDHGDEVDWPTIEVECVTLDSRADELGPAAIVFIDTEGAEVAILRGGERYIREHQPALVVEASPDHLARQGSSVEELHATLHDLGYRSYVVSLLSIEPLAAPAPSMPARNWLCLPATQASVVPALQRLLRRTALTPCLLGLNPLSRRTAVSSAARSSFGARMR
jgi:FkbM family methyltransferase